VQSALRLRGFTRSSACSPAIYAAVLPCCEALAARRDGVGEVGEQSTAEAEADRGGALHRRERMAAARSRCIPQLRGVPSLTESWGR